MARNRGHKDRPIPVAWTDSTVHYVGKVQMHRIEDGFGTMAEAMTLCGRVGPEGDDTCYGAYVKKGTHKCRSCVGRYARMPVEKYT